MRHIILLYHGNFLFEIWTNQNHSLTIEDMLYLHGYDVHDQADMVCAYEDGFAAAYRDDSGFYHIDIDGITVD